MFVSGKKEIKMWVLCVEFRHTGYAALIELCHLTCALSTGHNLSCGESLGH